MIGLALTYIAGLISAPALAVGGYLIAANLFLGGWPPKLKP